jgi:hypothetical protein
MPSTVDLSNRSNIGPEAMVDLGAADAGRGISRVEAGDGHTMVKSLAGIEARANANRTTDHYLYLDVKDDFVSQLRNGDVTIEVEYFDGPTGATLGLEYDSLGPACKAHPQVITMTGSDRWRRVRFEIADAKFAGRQNKSADFRFAFGGQQVALNRVWVRLPE